MCLLNERGRGKGGHGFAKIRIRIVEKSHFLGAYCCLFNLSVRWICYRWLGETRSELLFRFFLFDPFCSIRRVVSPPLHPVRTEKKTEKREMFPRIRRGRIYSRKKKREDKKEAFLKCDTKIPSLPGKTFFSSLVRGERARAASAYPSHYSVVSSCAVFPGCPAKKYKKKFPPSSCLSPSPHFCCIYIYTSKKEEKLDGFPISPLLSYSCRGGGRRRSLYPLTTFLPPPSIPAGLQFVHCHRLLPPPLGFPAGGGDIFLPQQSVRNAPRRYAVCGANAKNRFGKRRFGKNANVNRFFAHCSRR